MDQERLKRRVDGRTQAKAILELLTLDHPDKLEAFLDEVRSTLQPEKVLAEAVQEQRRLSELAAVRLKYGQYAGQRLDDVDRDYLEWMIDEGRETLATIEAFLKATAHLHGS